MPTRNLALLALLLAPTATLMISCTEGAAPETPETRPAFDNRPAQPGNSGIVRFEDAFAALLFDFDAGLLAIVGLNTTVADFCEGAEDPFDLASFQIKPHQLGEVNSLITAKSISIQVLAIPADFAGEDFCEDFADQPVLYSGTGSLRRTDNNFTETGTEGGRADSFGFATQGTLQDLVNGGQVQFSGILRLLITPDDEFREIVSDVTISR
jgi:hypothetical protein